MTTKKKTIPAKKQGTKKSTAPTAEAETPTAKPQPLSELEQRARKMALEGMRVLRRVAGEADWGGYPCSDGSDEDKALLGAGKWGEALRAVSEVLWALNPDAGYAMGDAGFWEADEAVGALEAEEKQAEREARNARRRARNLELRRYCAERQAKTDAEWKKAVAEGRVQKLVKYNPKTGRSVWRKAKA